MFVTVLGGSWRILHARQEKPWRFHRLLAEYQSILSIHRSVPTVLQRTLLMLFSLLVGNVTLKPLVARPRPCWRNSLVNLLIQNPKDYSFPSGHALSSFAAAMAIFMNHRKMGVAALLFAFIMGCTRLYFYVHYPTDVLAGMLFGLILGFFAYWIATKGRKKWEERSCA